MWRSCPTSEVKISDAVIALRLVLQLERVPSLPAVSTALARPNWSRRLS
jgi:hypothetical protein